MSTGPVVLFRAWRVIPGDRHLFGVYRRYAWRPREQQAECIATSEEHPLLRRLRGEEPLPKHLAPAPEGVHRCGFGGHYTLTDVFERFSLQGKVFGAFIASGDMYRGTLAARCQTVAPLALFDDTITGYSASDDIERRMRHEMIAAFAKHYAIPALDWPELMADVVRFGDLLQPTTEDTDA
jgi:hypothetical protein